MSKREMKKALKKAKTMKSFEWSKMFNNNIKAEELKEEIQHLEKIYCGMYETIGIIFETDSVDMFLDLYSKKLDEVNEKIFEAKAELAAL